MRALIVDDSRAARALIGRIMRELDFDVIEAAQGCEGLERLEAIGPFDVVLVDWNMPEMNGLDFVRAVRRDTRHASLPIVMCTSETEISQVVVALEAGASEYIMKPFSVDVVREKLALLGVPVC